MVMIVSQVLILHGIQMTLSIGENGLHGHLGLLVLRHVD